MKKVYEPAIKSNKVVSEEATKTMIQTSEENNKTLENLNNNFLEIMKYSCIKASGLLSPLAQFTDPDHTSQKKQEKDPDPNRVNDLLINKKIPVTLYNILLIFRDTDKKTRNTRFFENGN